MGYFSIFHWIIVLCFFAISYVAFKSIFSSGGGSISQNGSMVCPHCGTRGEPKKLTKGSLLIEIVLWLCLIIPGVIYSLWRMTSRYSVCPSCLQAGLIQAQSPMGKLLIEKHAPAVKTETACPRCHADVSPGKSVCPNCNTVLLA